MKRYDPQPDRSDVLTVSDLPRDLPNGEATILYASDPRGVHGVLCRIDDSGFVRTYTDGKYIPAEWEAEPRGSGFGGNEEP